jgi:endonuclease/exonuclease/phosphatase family metal-dependent hydrolase
MTTIKRRLQLLGAAVLLSSGTVARGVETSSTLRVMTFNVLHGGTHRGQPLAQTAEVIRAAKADVVGLQEIGGNIRELAKLLGWQHVQHGSSGIVTRLDITARYEGGIRVRLDTGGEADVFNVHLKPAPYQPYQLLEIPYGNAPFITTEHEAIDAAKAARGGQVDALLKQINALPDSGVPVFVTGDFNEPSHLDWTRSSAAQGVHPIKVAFPASKAMAAAGFADAWRVKYPDEIAKQGFTWTPLTKPDDPKDHHDRIDFVYSKGAGIELGEVRVIGEDEENADIVVAPYPSDHRAVMAEFIPAKNKGR